MTTPFPGMDPYLEDPALWSDFHGTFLLGIRAELNRLLPAPYLARWDRYVWIDEPEGGPPKPLGRPDVFVTDALQRNGGGEGVSLLEAPAIATLPAIEAKGKPFLKIIDVRGRRVVTVLELLSPANKSAGEDRDAYLAKRQEYLRSATNLVEIDLLRAGLRPPVEGPQAIADYYVMVCPAIEFPRAGLWPLTVRDPLPGIPIPLDPNIEPVKLALRPCLDRAYEEGRFGEEIDYHRPPLPPLNEPDAAWAQELISHKLGASPAG